MFYRLSFRQVIFSVFISLPMVAYSQTELEQFEEVAEAMSAKMNELFLVQDPSLKEVLPSTDWDDEFRSAAKCVLDLYRSEAGDEFVAQMLENGKKFASSELTNFDDIEKALDFMPDGISDARQIAISQECGMTDLTLKRMQESGFTDALRGKAPAANESE